MYYENPEFKTKVYKSWKIIESVLAQTTEPCQILHLSPMDGLEYDCLSLIVGVESKRTIMLNRNGISGLVNGQLYEDLWNKFDTIGPQQMAREIIALANVATVGEVAPSTINVRRISAYVVEWIEEHQTQQTYVGPLGWPGCPRQLFEVAGNKYDGEIWPTTYWGPDLVLGIAGEEVERIDQVSLVHLKNKDGKVLTSQLSADPLDQKYYAYIYRDPKTLKVRYAGYGTAPGRAYSVSHNDKISDVVESGEGFEILIAGPYRDEEEARNVEAALVSAHSPDLNLIQQPGQKFRHLGVPNEIGSRRTMPHLDVHEVGRITGGALIVLCNLTTQLKSRSSKVGPTNFTDDVVFSNIQDHWYVKKFLPEWIQNPESSPRVLVAVQGPTQDRIIIGAAEIDVEAWADTPVAPWDKHLHTIPLVKSRGLDVDELRGRQIDVKFGTGPSNYIMWVDGDGVVLHGFKMKGKTGKE